MITSCGDEMPEFRDEPKRRLFSDIPTDELRDMAARTDGGRANWGDWTREMLLAFFHNRFGQWAD